MNHTMLYLINPKLFSYSEYIIISSLCSISIYFQVYNPCLCITLLLTGYMCSAYKPYKPSKKYFLLKLCAIILCLSIIYHQYLYHVYVQVIQHVYIMLYWFICLCMMFLCYPIHYNQHIIRKYFHFICYILFIPILLLVPDSLDFLSLSCSFALTLFILIEIIRMFNYGT